jgi:hypothetical protein
VYEHILVMEQQMLGWWNAVRPKPSSRPAAGVLVVYIYYPQKIPPPEASDRPARAMRLRPSVVTDLAARGHILSLGGSSATIIIIKVYPSGPARTLTLTLYTIFAIPPPASFRMDHSGKRVSTTCLLAACGSQ